jgi:hypothetical protein
MAALSIPDLDFVQKIVATYTDNTLKTLTTQLGAAYIQAPASVNVGGVLIPGTVLTPAFTPLISTGSVTIGTVTVTGDVIGSTP